MEVGNHLKTPYFPIWVICKEFHYSVIFANDSRVNEKNDIKKFDLIYYDELTATTDPLVITLTVLE